MGSGINCGGVTYPGTDSGITSFVGCQRAAIVDNQTPDSVLMGFAASSGCPSSGSETWPAPLALACMRANRMLYSKVSGGDCNTGAYDFTGSTTGTALKSASSVFGKAAAVDPEPISNAILSGAATFANFLSGIFTSSHSAAVKREEDTLCQVTVAFNQVEAQIEAALASGNISIEQAKAALQQVVSQLGQQLNTITNGKHNAAWGYNLAMQALALYLAAIVYTSISSSGGSKGLLILGGGIAAAHFGGIL